MTDTDKKLSGDNLKTEEDANALLAEFMGRVFSIFDHLNANPIQAVSMLGFAAGFIVEEQSVDQKILASALEAGTERGAEFRRESREEVESPQVAPDTPDV